MLAYVGELAPQYIVPGDYVHIFNETAEVLESKLVRNGHSRIYHFYLSNGRFFAGIVGEDTFEVYSHEQ